MPQFSSDSLQNVSSPFKQVTKSFVQQCSLSSDGLFDAVIEGAADAVTDGTLEALHFLRIRDLRIIALLST